MKTIAVITGDWHIHRFKQFNENGRRLSNCLSLFSFFGGICKGLNIPLLFTGDLFENPKQIHNSTITKSFTNYRKYFEKEGIKFYAISGNHDQEDKNSLEHHSPTYLKAFSESFKTFKLLDFDFIEKDNYIIFGIPYLSQNIGIDKVLKDFRKIKTDKPKILIIHTDLHGALSTDDRVVGSTENIGEDMAHFFRGFDLVVAGHIHKPQIIVENKVYMIGAPQQQNRGDKNCQMGYWLLKMDNNRRFKMEFKETNFPRFIEIPEEDYDGLSEKEKLSNYYIPIPKAIKIKTVKGFTEFTSHKQRRKLVDKWAKAIGETNQEYLEELKLILNTV